MAIELDRGKVYQYFKNKVRYAIIDETEADRFPYRRDTLETSIIEYQDFINFVNHVEEGRLIIEAERSEGMEAPIKKTKRSIIREAEEHVHYLTNEDVYPSSRNHSLTSQMEFITYEEVKVIIDKFLEGEWELI